MSAALPCHDHIPPVLRRPCARSGPSLHTTSSPEGFLLRNRAGARPRPRFRTAITSLTSPTRSGLARAPQIRSGFRNTRLHFNATFALSGSRAHTIFDRIFGLTQMNGPLCARSVGKPLLGSTTGNDTRACIPEKRSLCAKATSSPESHGAVAVVSHGPTLSAAIFEARLAECASNRCWRKRPHNDNGSGVRINSCRSGKVKAYRHRRRWVQ